MSAGISRQTARYGSCDSSGDRTDRAMCSSIAFRLPAENLILTSSASGLEQSFAGRSKSKFSKLRQSKWKFPAPSNGPVPPVPSAEPLPISRRQLRHIPLDNKSSDSAAIRTEKMPFRPKVLKRLRHFPQRKARQVMCCNCLRSARTSLCMRTRRVPWHLCGEWGNLHSAVSKCVPARL